MMMIPIRWSLQRRNIMPILEIVGESMVKESEFFMINEALGMIEKASEFAGIPFETTPPYTEKRCIIAVSFSLIFRFNEDLDKFVKYWQKN